MRPTDDATQVAAVGESIRQMNAHSGPTYDLARKRGWIMSEGYWKAGRPAHISLEHGPYGPAYIRVIRHRRNSRREPATEEEWLKWRTRAAKRGELRRDLRSGVGKQDETPRALDGASIPD